MVARRTRALAAIAACVATLSLANCTSADDEPCAGSSCETPTDAVVDATAEASTPGALDGEVVDAGAESAALSVTVAPSSVSLQADASAVVSVSVTRPPGVTGSVDVELDGLGIAFTSAPLQIAAAESTAPLSIGARASAPQGERTFTVSARLGALRASAPLSVTVAGVSGDLDGLFGLRGRFKTYVYPNDGVAELALQPDGKLLLGVSGGNEGAVLRVHPDGTLDATFGVGGVAKVAHGVVGMHLRADGKIVVAGTKNAYPAASPAAITRLLANGTPDATFGALPDGGAAPTPGTVLAPIDPLYTEALAITVQPDEKILVAGYVTDNFANYYRAFLARFSANGAPDTGFGTGGVYKGDDSFWYLYAPIRVSASGIYALGGRYVGGVEIPVVVKFTPGGAPDASFATGGFLEPGKGAYAAGLVVAPDESLLVGFPLANITIARYLPGGGPDLAWGTGGAITSVPGAITDLVVQSDGKLAISGNVGNDFLAVRLTSSGALDPSFGGTGWRRTDFGGANDSSARVLVSPTKSIFVAGQSGGHAAVAKHIP